MRRIRSIALTELKSCATDATAAFVPANSESTLTVPPASPGCDDLDEVILRAEACHQAEFLPRFGDEASEGGADAGADQERGLRIDEPELEAIFLVVRTLRLRFLRRLGRRS